MSFHCRRCNRTGRAPAVRAGGNTAHRCRYCGSAHSLQPGQLPTPIGPVLLPAGTPGARVSAWYDVRYRPYVTGVFECEFRDGLRLMLRWNGRAWVWCDLVVDITDMYKWRGALGE